MPPGAHIALYQSREERDCVGGPGREARSPTRTYGSTVTVTVALAVARPSLTLKANVSDPVNPELGVYVKLPFARIVTEPFGGAATSANVSGSLSASLAFKVPDEGVLRGVLTTV